MDTDLEVKEKQEEEEMQTMVKEGKAEILVESSKGVFYNPVQEFNRDMSVAVLRLFAEEELAKKRKGRPPQENEGDCGNNGSSSAGGDSVDDALTTGSVKRTASGEIKQQSQSVQCRPGVHCQEGITVLEALSATGLRSMRFALEVGGIKRIIANDISRKAVESIDRNIKHNNVQHLVTTSQSDASLLMYKSKAEGVEFDAVDLDPYGCPSRFLDASVQCVREGGLLLVTCTDMAVLCGNAPETCYSKYGAISLHTTPCHEMALRIVLQCIESHANRYGRYITPLLSFSADFYVRVVVRLNTSPALCKQTISKLSHVYQCVGCKSFQLHPMGVVLETQGKSKPPHPPPSPSSNEEQNREGAQGGDDQSANGQQRQEINGNKKKNSKRKNNNVDDSSKGNKNNNRPVRVVLSRSLPADKCQHCGHQLMMGGPIWSGPINDTGFVSKLLGRLVTGGGDSGDSNDDSSEFVTARRMEAVLSLIYDELIDVPLYYTVSALCSKVHCSTIPLVDFRSALLNAGYRVSLSHCAPNSVKTDAPASFLWKVVRSWVLDNDHPVSAKRLEQPGNVVKSLLYPCHHDQDETKKVDFGRHPGAALKPNVLRYQANPQPNWGPGTRAITKLSNDEGDEKRKNRQNRKCVKKPTEDKRDDAPNG